jgi:hypothetical protein
VTGSQLAPLPLGEGKGEGLQAGLCLLLALLSACAAPRPSAAPELDHAAQLDTRAGGFRLEYADADRDAVVHVQRAVQRAAPALSRWGTLEETVVVRVMPDHAALELAADRPGYAWLRAWARYDEVLLQSPRTWGLAGARPGALDEVVLHELTHCLMYQLASDRLSWGYKRIPLWFREGMASVTARQGYRWPGRAELARFVRERPGVDPLGAPESLYRDDADVVYGAAHHAFEAFLTRFGEGAVRRVLDDMAQGPDFDSAFEGVFEVTRSQFEADVLSTLRDAGGEQVRSPALPPSPRGL